MSGTKRGRSILLLDDEKRQRDIISLILRGAEYDVTALGSPVEALQSIEQGGPFDAIVCDLRMPLMDGIEFLQKARRMRPGQVVIVVTAHGSVPTAVEAIKKGAYDYLTKPLDRDEFLLTVERAVEQSDLVRENRLLQAQIRKDYSLEAIIGEHGRMQELSRLVRKVAPSDLTVMIYGESGTGKELVARALHLLSPRGSRPMEAINCAAIPENLLESELFGYVKGAFTGAISSKKGLFEQADGTTLLLDEIGDMGLPLQGKLLRVLQEKEIQRVGSVEKIPVDVRIISSTHRDLGELVRSGAFREDLYYRLNTFPVSVPPLRERATDIPLLVEHFIRTAPVPGHSVRKAAPEALRALKEFSWPGNVRQLKSVIDRAVVLAEGNSVELKDLPDEILDAGMGSLISSEFDLPLEGVNLEELEKHLIRRAMERSGGVIAKAAPLLGLSYRTLQYRLQKYGFSGASEDSDASSFA